MAAVPAPSPFVPAASVAAENFQAFAADTLAQMQQRQPAVASANWWEPLGSKVDGQPVPKPGGQAMSAVTTLYRSPDIHARIVAMSKWYFPHDNYNTLLQMVGECYGNGRLVEPTFTLLEGQAIANNPIFAGKAQEMGISAFYDYAFTIDWMAHRLDLVENILNTLQGIGRGAGNLGDVRFFQEQLDAMLMSPHRVSWSMWDKPLVRKHLIDPSDGTAAKDQADRNLFQFLSYPLKQVPEFKSYAESLVKGAFANAASPSIFKVGDEMLMCIRLACQEAALLQSPLWNELCAIGQGLFRVYLTQAKSNIGYGNGPVQQGSFVNAFEVGSPPINVIPSTAADTVFTFGFNGVTGLSTQMNDDEQKLERAEQKFLQEVGTVATALAKAPIALAMAPIRMVAAAAALFTSDNDADATEVAEVSAEIANAKGKTFTVADASGKSYAIEATKAKVNAARQSRSAVMRGLVQPKCTNLLLYACLAKEWTTFLPYMRSTIPRHVQDEYTRLKSNPDELYRVLLDSAKHTGTGGAIGTYICNGTDGNGRFLTIGMPTAMVVNSAMVQQAMKEQTHHPIHFCAELADALRRGVTFNAADMAAAKLDAFYQPKAGPQNAFEHLRARLRELENRYALIRNAQANADQHPIATADQIFTDDFLGYGPHAKLPQCPAGTLPMIFDSIHKTQLSPEQWQKQIVRINGEPLLPAHLQVQGCMPARRTDPDPDPITSSTNVFQGLMGLLKPDKSDNDNSK